MNENKTAWMFLVIQVTGMILVFALLALYVIPTFQKVYTDTAQTIPRLTRMIFSLKPIGLLAVSLILGSGIILGGIRPNRRWILHWSALLLFIFGTIVVLGLAAPVIL